MINQPAYVRYNSVVTAAQWQQLYDYVLWQLLERPTVVLSNVVSYSTSRTFTASTVPTIGGEITFSADSAVNYTNLATGTSYTGTTNYYGVNSRISVSYDNSLAFYTPVNETVEPLTPLGRSSTAYCLAARTAAVVTRFMGRQEGLV